MNSERLRDRALVQRPLVVQLNSETTQRNKPAAPQEGMAWMGSEISALVRYPIFSSRSYKATQTPQTRPAAFACRSAWYELRTSGAQAACANPIARASRSYTRKVSGGT